MVFNSHFLNCCVVIERHKQPIQETRYLPSASNLGENKLSIKVDYKRDISEVCGQTAIAILKHEQNLSFLSVAGLPRDGQFTALPPRVPDWRVYESPADLSMADSETRKFLCSKVVSRIGGILCSAGRFRCLSS
jgi:hypothetical protein